MKALFYKGEDIVLTFTSTTDMSSYTKVVKFFTPFSVVKTAAVSAVNTTTFTAKLTKTDTADLKTGRLNIVLEFTDGSSNKNITKTIECKLADAYIDGEERFSSTLDSEIVFLQNNQITVSFLSTATVEQSLSGKLDVTTASKYNDVDRMMSISGLIPSTKTNYTTDVVDSYILTKNGVNTSIAGWKTTGFITNSNAVGYRYFQAKFNGSINVTQYANIAFYDSSYNFIKSFVIDKEQIVPIMNGYYMKISVSSAVSIYEVSVNESFTTNILKQPVELILSSPSDIIPSTVLVVSSTQNKVLLQSSGAEATLAGSFYASTFIAGNAQTIRYISCSFPSINANTGFCNLGFFDSNQNFIGWINLVGRRTIAIPIGFYVKVVTTNGVIYEGNSKSVRSEFDKVELSRSVENSIGRVLKSPVKLDASDYVSGIMTSAGAITANGSWKTSIMIQNTESNFMYIQANFNSVVTYGQYWNYSLYDSSGTLISGMVLQGLHCIMIPVGYHFRISINVTTEAYKGTSIATVNESSTFNLKKILWIGTSIPEGSTYPENSCANLNIKCTNNSVGSSGMVITNTWAGATGRDGKELTETVAEKESRYRQYVTSGFITEAKLDEWKSYSFENLIVPYIDNTIDSVDAIVIDHGYNDRAFIADEVSGIELENWEPDENADRTTFVGSFKYLASKIWSANPNVILIIGGYMESNSSTSVRSGVVLRQMHEAIASAFGIPILDVYNYSGFSFKHIPGSSSYISDFNIAYGTSYVKQWTDGDGNITFFQKYCPDGVHPYSDLTGKANSILDKIYTKLLRDIL